MRARRQRAGTGSTRSAWGDTSSQTRAARNTHVEARIPRAEAQPTRGPRTSLPYAWRVGWMTSIARWAQETSKWEPSQRSPSVWQGGSPSKSMTMLDAVRKFR